MKNHNKKSNRGMEACLLYYRTLYGDRWNGLHSALLQKKHGINIISESDNSAYYLDPASLASAQLIYRICSKYRHTTLLDLCAAPGGKALAILQEHLRVCTKNIGTSTKTHILDTEQNKLSQFYLTLNEKSRNRYIRLKQNIEAFIHSNRTEATLAPSVVIQYTNVAGSLVSKHHRNTFDLIIVDAPCSNSRFVFQDTTLLEKWNEKKYKCLAAEQFALLCAAIDSCKNRGIVVYITCSINPRENEHYIARVCTKRHVRELRIQELFQTLPLPQEPHDIAEQEIIGKIFPHLIFEPSTHGYYILPDLSKGAGPLYMCILEKSNTKDQHEEQ